MKRSLRVYLLVHKNNTKSYITMFPCVHCRVEKEMAPTHQAITRLFTFLLVPHQRLDQVAMNNIFCAS